jgi:hypothetical protein
MNAPVPIPLSTSRRRIVWHITAGALLLGLLAMLVAAAAILHGLDASPVQVILNGEPIALPQSLAELSWGRWMALVGGLALALLALTLVVPVALLATVAAVALALLVGLGLPLLVVALVVAMLVAPLALIGWLLWRALRPARTIAA